MHDRLELGPRFRIAEDDVCQRSAVELPAANDGGPPLRDAGKPFGPRSDDLTREVVGIDDPCTEFGEDAGDGALTRADPAGQPDAQMALLQRTVPELGFRRVLGDLLG
jgi:hypothetical protein